MANTYFFHNTTALLCGVSVSVIASHSTCDFLPVTRRPTVAASRSRLMEWRTTITSDMILKGNEKKVPSDICIDVCTVLPYFEIFENEYFPERYVVCMQKDINISPVVWPLTKSVSQYASHRLPCIYSKMVVKYICKKEYYI